jgi:superfamily II DNA helicase RecQ
MYQIVLETVQKYNEKFGATLLSKVLTGSGEKRITEWNLDLYEHYNVFFEYSLECIIAIFEALVQE